MGWNYRIIDFGTHLALHEVHYDKAGNIKAYGAEPASFVCDLNEGQDGIARAVYLAFRDAQDRSILKVAQLP